MRLDRITDPPSRDCRVIQSSFLSAIRVESVSVVLASVRLELCEPVVAEEYDPEAEFEAVVLFDFEKVNFGFDFGRSAANRLSNSRICCVRQHLLFLQPDDGATTS